MDGDAAIAVKNSIMFRELGLKKKKVLTPSYIGHRSPENHDIKRVSMKLLFNN